jgi:hypothetical protein
MRLSRRQKVLLGVATAWPPAYMLVFATVMVTAFVPAMRETGLLTTQVFPGLVKLHIAAMLDLFVLMPTYVFLAFKNDKISRDARPLWAVLLIFFNVFAMLVYYVLYVNPLGDDEPQARRLLRAVG